MEPALVLNVQERVFVRIVEDLVTRPTIPTTTGMTTTGVEVMILVAPAVVQEKNANIAVAIKTAETIFIRIMTNIIVMEVGNANGVEEMDGRMVCLD